jgi:CheY-like chemotaxis protein
MQRKVLIAETNATVARRLSQALTSLGCEVATAASGPEALEKAVAWKPHLLLSNLMLPGLNADKVAEAMMEVFGARTIPIVVYDDSSLEQSRDQYVGGRTGIVAFLRGHDTRSLLAAAQNPLGR